METSCLLKASLNRRDVAVASIHRMWSSIDIAIRAKSISCLRLLSQLARMERGKPPAKREIQIGPIGQISHLQTPGTWLPSPQIAHILMRLLRWTNSCGECWQKGFLSQLSITSTNDSKRNEEVQVMWKGLTSVRPDLEVWQQWSIPMLSAHPELYPRSLIRIINQCLNVELVSIILLYPCSHGAACLPTHLFPLMSFKPVTFSSRVFICSN